MKPEKAGVTKQGPSFEMIFSWKHLTWKISLDAKLRSYVAG